MKNNSSKKSWIIIGIIIVAAFLIYYFYLSGSGTSTDSGLLAQEPEVEVAAAQVLGLLNQINALNIDSTFFQNPAYQSLVDYTVPIPTLNVGRADPFAPIPGFYSKTKI